jgi:glycosyltransferase involved in cell wall biosynthesis
LIIGLTAPPLISFIGALLAKKKMIKFCYWIMDMQPELAIHSGFIKKNSFLAKILTKLGRSTLNNSDKIIVLDRFMKKYLVESLCVSEDKIEIAPVWPVIDNIYLQNRLENPFRVENNFGDKIVIMYSGNHSFVHQLDTLLNLSRTLKEDKRFIFVFIGGGVRKKEVTEFKNKFCLENIVQLSYQPRENIHLSLGSSDIQVVILGDGLVGFTHPNKIYGALFIGKPIIYIGPSKSHISEILLKLSGNILVNHSEIKELKEKLLNLCDDFSKVEAIGKKNQEFAYKYFSPELLINKMCYDIESVTPYGQ